MFNYEQYKESADYIKNKIGELKPKTAIILGSGLGVLSDEFEEKIIIKYKEIPNFPISTVEGHAGELIIGKLNGTQIIAMNGRIHYYEGYDLKEVTFPIRVFKLLGIEKLIITNAAGGINTNFEEGDFMVINDYLSFFAESALRGTNLKEFGERFTDMSKTFDKTLSAKLKEIIKKHIGRVQEGVYAYMKGPTFETPAEIRALRVLGADAVGLSTVPEAIIAHHCNIKTVAVSCVTNMAAGVLDEILSYDDVKQTAERVKIKFKEIIKEYVKVIEE
ncbi:MAG: purine-nucleoside phosphorylase [Clostridia bacterium]|nr:purine-nucleoside phosphorylase [Clostridia bacterium]